MTTDNKTLADVQPGGRVRLGDQALRVFSAGRWTYDGTGQAFSHEEMDAAAFVVYRDAALPAQPSLGGQDAMADAARRVISDVDSGDYGGTISMATYDALVAALSARQPVGEPAMYQVRPRSFSGGWREVTKREYDDRGPFPGYDEAEWERRTLYAAPPAQAVDLGQFRQPVQDWLDDAQASMEEHGDSDGVFGYAIEEGTRLLALIDSQAVGK